MRDFEEDEFYHVYNRGVDKRTVFMNIPDMKRFLQSMSEFNTEDPIGSLYLNSIPKNISNVIHKPLVDIVSYCLNSNHYHFILKQRMKNGVSEFMKRLGGGYTKYFNHKYKRSGVLFQGKYKAKHIESNEHLLHLSAYVNLNDRAHQLRRPTSQSSWEEYIGDKKEGLCEKSIILKQFKNKAEYKEFAEEALENILERKKLMRDFKELLLE